MPTLITMLILAALFYFCTPPPLQLHLVFEMGEAAERDSGVHPAPPPGAPLVETPGPKAERSDERAPQPALKQNRKRPKRKARRSARRSSKKRRQKYRIPKCRR